MLIVAREHLATFWRELEAHVRAHGGSSAGMEALNSIRLECGTPWFGHDYDDKNIPHEAGLEHSHISYEKGCYTGQEIVERVRSRGHVNRRLTLLQFLAAQTPVPERIFAPGMRLTTKSAMSPARRCPRCSAADWSWLRAARTLGLGTRLDASGAEAEVISPPLFATTSRE